MDNTKLKIYYYKAEHKLGFACFFKSLLEFKDNYYVSYFQITEDEYKMAVSSFGTEPHLDPNFQK